MSPSTQPSQLSANPFGGSPSVANPSSQATAQAQAANIASGKAPVPLSLASRPKPTSAFGIAEEAGVLSQGANPLAYTVPPAEDEAARGDGDGAGTGVLAAPGPKRVVTDEEMDQMSQEEVRELEENGANWISGEDISKLSVDELRKNGYGRNQTGK